MTFPPEDKPFRRGLAPSGDPAWRFRTWTGAEWDEIRPGCHPPGAGRFGAIYVEIRCGDRDDRGDAVDPGGWASDRGGPMRRRRLRPCGMRPRDIPVDSIIVDLGMPGIREFLQRAILDGLIRTIPAGDGRVYLIPLPRSSRSPGRGRA